MINENNEIMEQSRGESIDEEIEGSTQVTEYTVEELLISCVECRPALWDSRLPLNQRSKTIRENLWLEIFSEFGENPEFSIEFLQKKWRHLRDTFVRIKGEYIPSGSGARKKKKWEYYDQLLFLNDTINFRPTVSNVLPPSPSTSSCPSPLLSPISSNQSSDEKKGGRMKKNSIEGAILEALGKVNKEPVLIQPPLAPEETTREKINPICIRMSQMLGMMPQNERTRLEIKLLQIAYEGSQNYLK